MYQGKAAPKGAPKIKNIPTGVPLVYTLDDNMKPIKSPNAMGELSGEYLGNQEEIKARIEGVKAQTG